MIPFLVRSLVRVGVTVILASALVFFAIRLLPGDAIELRWEERNLPASEIEQERSRLGLDEPVYAQYGTWGGHMLRGDFGTSLWTGRSVADEIGLRYPVTLELAVFGTAVAALLGITLGTLTAVYRGSIGDYLARCLSVLLLSVPEFLLATLALLVLSVYVGWIPSQRYVSLADNPRANLTQIAIPVLLIGTAVSAVIMRYTRSTVLDTLSQDYVRTARSKGLHERSVIVRHVLRNALAPILTVVGLAFASLIGGTLVIEVIFGLPGLGSYFLQAATLRDYPSVQALALIFAIGVVLTNTVIDTLVFILVPTAK